MIERYFAKVDIGKGYVGLVKIVEDTEDFGAYAYGMYTEAWNKDNYFLEAKFDTTHYDEISKERADKLIAKWRSKK